MADIRLAQHIEKGNEDGLYISSVASCSNLWALIMDAGTGFSAQVHELSPHFLHKVIFLSYYVITHYFSHELKLRLIGTLIISPTVVGDKLKYPFFFGSEGMDYGALGEKLLHQCCCWS